MNPTKSKPARVQPSVAGVVQQHEARMLEFQKRDELIELFRDFCEGIILDGQMRKAETRGE